MQLVARSIWTLGGVFVLAACAQGAAVDPQAVGQDPVKSAANDSGTAPLDAGDTPLDGGGGQAQDPGNDPDAPDPKPAGSDAGGEVTDPDPPEGDAGPSDSVTTDAGSTVTKEPDASTPPPPDPCAEICGSNLTPDAKTCASAVTIGRKAALADDFVYNGDTRGDGNNQDLTFINCADGNTDNFFRIYLYKGDTITARISTAEYDPVITLVQGECTAPVAAACRDVGLDAESEVLTVAIEEDGFYHVVADGPYGSTAPEGQGRYTLSVSVTSSSTPAVGQCNCP